MTSERWKPTFKILKNTLMVLKKILMMFNEILGMKCFYQWFLKSFGGWWKYFVLIELKGAEKADAGKYECATSKCQDLIFKHCQICKIGIQMSQIVRFSEFNIFASKSCNIMLRFISYLDRATICQKVIIKIIKYFCTFVLIFNI